MLLEELISEKKEKFKNVSGSNSLFTDPGDESYRTEKDFFKKYFTRPFLTKGIKNHYMLPVKKK